MKIKATCANCNCRGKLFKRNQNSEVILVPNITVYFGKEEDERYEKGFLAAHGFATGKQVLHFLLWGTLFWLTVMLLANYIGFEKNRFKPGVGSYCVREYKKCTSEIDWNLCASSMYDCGNMENENYGLFNISAPEKMQDFSVTEQPIIYSSAQNKANENLCLYTAHISNNICENLCFSSDFSYDFDENYKIIAPGNRYDHQKNAECKNICILASDMEVEDDCPLHKRCPNGCPCPGYKCSEEVLDFNLAQVTFLRYDNRRSRSSIYKISVESNTVEFEKLPLSTGDDSFCFVQFHGDYYVIQSVYNHKFGNKLILHKIDRFGNIKIISEEIVSSWIQMMINFYDKAKICGRGYYTQDEERIIFCSTYDTNDICFSKSCKFATAQLSSDIYS